MITKLYTRNYLNKVKYKFTYIKNSFNRGTNYCKNLGLKNQKQNGQYF